MSRVVRLRVVRALVGRSFSFGHRSRNGNRFVALAITLILVATSVQSSVVQRPETAPNVPGSTTPAATNGISAVTSVPGVDVVQPATGTTGGNAGGALSTTDGAIGGVTTGNATQRVEPPAVTFPSTSTELVGQSDAHRRVVANPNGTLTETTSVGRLNYQDSAGAWRAIDTSLVPASSVPGYDLTERANNGTIVFNTTSASDSVAALIGSGYSLAIRVPGLTGRGKRAGGTGLVYGGTGSDASIVFDSTSDGFEFRAVLAHPDAPATYSFAIETDGLTLAVAPDGRSVEVLSGQAPNQKALGEIGAPTLLDARGVVAPAAAVKVSLDASAAGLRTGETLLTYSIDPTWLRGSGRAYPVTLDPTACIRWDATSNCTNNLSGQDNGYVETYISAATPDVVGTGSYDYVGVQSSMGATRSLYFFPHVTLPDGAQIVTATFGVHMAGGTASGQVVRASGIAATWSGYSATWNNQPSTDASTNVDTPISSLANGWLNMDVSSIVRPRYTRNGADWKPDYGFELQLENETTPCTVDACGGLHFDASGMGHNEPQLTITYVVPHVKIGFDPALGPDFAPSKMLAGSINSVAVQVNNNGSGYTYNRCGGSTADCYEIGYRWYDTSGQNVNIAGFTPSGMADLPADLANGTWSSVFNLPIATPPAGGQYGLRLDLVHVVKGQKVYASDWAYPSLYLAKAKDDVSSTNVRWTGQSVIARNDFAMSLTTGVGANGYPKSVSLPDGSNASVDLTTGNLTVSGSSGLGFTDLGGPINLTYYYDSSQAAQATGTSACDLILGACGWGTNFDESLRPGTGTANFVYRDPAGNRYFVGTNANGQLVSDAPVKIDRPRVTVLDENVVSGWQTTGSGLPTITTATAANGTHSYGFDSTNTAGATTNAGTLDINQYPLARFSVKSTAGGMGVGFQIKDNTTGATRWLVYTFGTDFSLPDPAAVKVALGGDLTDWLGAGGSAGELNLWSRVTGDSRFGGTNDDYSVVALGLYGNGSVGTDYIDALRFEPSSTAVFDDPSASMPAWTSGAAKAVSTTRDKQVGASALEILPAAAADEPTCKCLSTSLSAVPYVTWYWRKVGGTSVAETFYLHDARDSKIPAGSVTYYAGPSVPSGVDPKTAIQVSQTAPNAWTQVTRDLEDDARQLLGFYNNDPSGTYAAAGSAPAPDPVILDGYQLLAFDGSYAGFDWEQMLTQPSLDVTTAGQVRGDDFVVTLPGGETHRFNQDGLLTSIRDLDGHMTTLVWSYDFGSSGGASAYKLVGIHAPSEGMPTGSGDPAIRRIDVTYGSGKVSFAEKLGTAAATSGRTVEFGVDSSGNLVTVDPARHVGACAAAGAPSGCIGYAYDSSHRLTRVYDPRYDGSNDYDTTIGYTDGSVTAITPAATDSPLLRVLSSNANPTGLYQRPEWQDASAVASNYAYYADLTDNGSVYTEFRPIPCTAAGCAGGTTTPAVPVDMLASYRTDGLNEPTQETRYRLPGNTAPVISRRGTLAVAKIDNYPDPLSATQVTWTQSADQYVASVEAGNGDIYKTFIAYNDLHQQTTTTTPVSNPAFGPSAPWSKQSVSRTVEQVYDTAGHLVQADDNTYLSNTGFENALTGWTGTGATVDPAVDRSGVASLSLAGSASASQKAQLLPGQTFRLQAWLRSDGGSPVVGLSYERTDGTWAALPLDVPAVGGDWTQLSNDVTIPLDGTGQVELKFSVSDGSGAVHVDDVALMTSFSATKYNALGQVVALTDITGHVTEFSYAPDKASLPTGMPEPGQTPAIFPTTSTANYVDGAFDPAHPDQDVAAHITYDLWGHSVRQTDADGVTTWTLYAPNETDVAASTDALGDTTSFTYDEVGNKLTVTPPNGSSEKSSISYDFLNKPVDSTAPDGVRTHYVYDGAGRLLTKYENYATGHPKAGTDTDVATGYVYDVYGHVVQTIADQGVSNISTESTYDLMGNVVTTTTHAVAGDAGRTTTKIFDAAGHPAGVEDAISPSAAPAPACPTGLLDVWERMSAFGTPVYLNITRADEKGSVTFSGTQGQRVSIAVGSTNGYPWWTQSVTNPDGTYLQAPGHAFYGSFTDVMILPQTGTYSFMVDPDGTTTGTFVVTIYNVPPDPALSIASYGSPVDLNFTTPGQNGTVTFTGTAGQRISIEVASTDGYPWWTQSITNPDGTYLQAPGHAFYDAFSDALILPQTGTYTIYVDPDSMNIGTYPVTVWNMPPDPAVSISAFGSPVNLDFTTPGQNGTVTFSGTTGQRVNVTVGSTNGYPWWTQSLKNPDGTYLAAPGHAFYGSDTGVLTLPQTGTYTFVLDPDAMNTGLYVVTVNDDGTADASSSSGVTMDVADPAPAALAATAGRAAHSTAEVSNAPQPLADVLPRSEAAPQAVADTTGTCYCNAVATFDLSGRAVSAVDTRGTTTVTWFDLEGRRVRTIANYVAGAGSTADQNVSSSIQYDTMGLPVASTDPIGRVTTVKHDSMGHVVRTIRPDDSWVRTDYTPAGRVLAASAPGASGQGDDDVSWTRNVYDAAGRQIQSLRNYDRSGAAQYQYDGFETDSTACSGAADGAFVLNDATADKTADSVVAASGLERLRVTAGGGEGSGVACALIGSFQPGQTYHVRVQVDGPEGVGLTVTLGQDVHSSTNKATTQVTATGAWQWVDLDWTPSSAHGTSASLAVVTAASADTRFYLDDVSVWNAASPATNIPTTSVFNVDGKIVRSLLPPGHAGEPELLTTSSYDVDGTMRSVTMAADAARPADAADANLTTTYAHDSLGRRTDTTDPTGVVAHVEYDRLGNAVASTANHVTGGSSDGTENVRSTFAYDALGELVGTCSPAAVAAGCDPSSATDATAWHYSYDAMGHMTTQTPPSANPADSNLPVVVSTDFVYDVSGLLSSTCSYSAGGCANALRHTDATYDKLGRQIATRLYAGSGTSSPELTSAFEYNAAGQELSTSFDGSGAGEGQGTIHYLYDTLGNQTSVSGDTAATTAVYNPDGTVSSRTDATGSSAFTYDRMGQLLTSTSPVYSGTLTYSWRLDGLMDTRGWPNGQVAGFSYDGANRPIGESVGSIATVTQTYDRNGNVTSESQNLTGVSGTAGAGTQTYTYDKLGRVLTDTMTDSGGGQVWQKSYAYDADSNRIKVTDTGVVTAYEYNTLDQIVASSSGGVRSAFAYDSYGNMTQTLIGPDGGTGTYTPADSAPTNLVAVAAAYNKVNLTWTAPVNGANLSSYVISRNGTTLTSVAAGETSMTDWTAKAGTPYTYTISAVDSSGGATQDPDPALVTTPAYTTPDDKTAPSTPGGLVGTVRSGSEIDLAWNASTDNAAVAAYRVYRDGTLIATVGSTSWFDTGLAAGSTHKYTVSAVDAAGNASAASDPSTATTTVLDATAPSSPTDVTATSTAWNYATVTWTASSDDVGVTSYTISRDGTAIGTVSGVSGSFIDATTRPSTPYTYTVTASDAAGNTSAASTEAPVTTPAYTPPTETNPPSTPTALTATLKGSTEIDLSWSASTDDTSVAGYEVFRNGTLVATTASTTYVDSPLPADSPFTYYVVALDGSGNTSGQSATASTATPGPDTTAPTVPTDVSATSTEWGSATVSWTASTDDVRVTSYAISRNGTLISQVAGSETSFVDVTTQPLAAYNYTVTASDAAGNTSAASIAGPVTIPASTPPADATPPSTPTGLTAKVKNATEIDLSWSASTDDTAVAGYRVYRNGTLIATTASTTYADTPTAAGVKDTYDIVAIDGTGNGSAHSATATATTPAPDKTAPTVPSGVVATASAWNKATLSWNASTDAVGVNSYTISRNGTALSKVSGTTTSFSDVTTGPSTTYSYTVTASDAAGNTSAASSTVSLKTPACTSCTTTTTLAPVADSYVNQVSSGTNYGTSASLLVKGASGSTEKTYLRFNTATVPAGSITGATLKVYSTTASSSGYTVKSVADTTWGETTIKYSNAPAMGSTITSVGSTTAGAYSSATVTGAVTTRGLISFGLTDPSTSIPITFDARENSTAADRPQLVVTSYALPTDTTAPSTPGGLVGTVKSGSEIDLAWNASTDNTAVAAYRVYRDGTLIATVGSTSWFDTGLAAGSTHKYTVSAVDAAGHASAQTAALSKTTTNVAPIDNTKPSIPTSVHASSTGPDSVAVTWSASTDNIGVTSYTIGRNGTPISKVAGTEAGFTDVTVQPSGTATYTVTASDAAGNASGASSGTTVVIPSTTPAADTSAPSKPSGLSATVKSGSEIDLSWSASTDNTAVAGYSVYRDGTLMATVGSTSWFDTGLAGGSHHSYTVTAFDAAGNVSPSSDAASATTTAADTSAPSVPTGVSATAPAWNSTDVTWTASTDGFGVTSYTISRDGAVIGEVAGSATSFVDVTTRPSTPYTYTVTASDAAGNSSAASSGASVTTPAAIPPADTQAPSVPSGLKASAASAGEIDLSWSASTDDLAVAGYRVYRDGTLIATAGSTSWFDTGLAAGSTHSYAIVAVDAAGNASAACDPASGATPATDTSAPSVPTDTTATATAWNSVTVSWTASTDDVGVTSYTILANGTQVGVVSGSATSFTDATTQGSTPYTYTVIASDAAGNACAQSDAASVTTPAMTQPVDTTAPTVPSGLTATSAPGEIDLSWSASTDDMAVAGYSIVRDGTPIATSYSTSFADTAAAVGTPHTYTVAAFDGAGNNSDPSASATATTASAQTASVSYTYDIANRLTAITTASGTATTFTIDALGRHSSQKIGSDPASTYSYLGSTDTVVAISSGSTVTRSAVDALGDRVATVSGASFGYLLPDLHGNQVAAVDAAGTTITAAFAYDAYGNLVSSVTSSLPTPWRYQGRILESAPGAPDLYDFQARSYDPALGTFTSMDSVAGSVQNPVTLNRYLYAGADPTTLVDPDGHCWGICINIDPVGFVKSTVNTAVNTAGQVAHAVTSTVSSAVNTVTSAVSNAYNTATSALSSAWNTATHTISQAWNTATNAVSKAWNTAVSVTTTVVNHVVNTAAQVTHEVTRAATQVAHVIADTTTQVVSYASSHASLVTHLALGAATFIPVIGSAAAIADAGLYMYEGDYLSASLSLLAVIPGGELLGEAGKLAEGAEDLDKAANVINDVDKADQVANDLDKVENVVTDANKVDEGASDADKLENATNSCPLSFTPDTKVATAAGKKAISSLKVGDTVEAYDPRTGVTAPHTVSAVMTNLDPVIEHLATDQGSIDTTPNHPFFTADRGWIDAGSLKIGEKVRTASSGTATITGFTLQAEPSTMWDITVDGAHSFFVGAGAGVLVHNCGGDEPLQAYDVGPADELYGRSVPGDGLQVHHGPQAHPAEQAIPGYVRRTGPAIALPDAEHFAVNAANIRGDFTGTAEELLEATANNLRRYTNAPENAIQKLLGMSQ